MEFEGLREQVVQVHLVRLVDSGDRHGAAIAGRAGARHLAGGLLLARRLDGRGRLGADLYLLCTIPVLEGRVACSEVGHPLVRVCHDFLVDAVLEIFLLVRIQKEIKTSQVAEGDELG